MLKILLNNNQIIMFLRGFLYLLTFIFIIPFSNAQGFDKPNYKRIKKQIKKKKSTYFYPNLLKKFNEGSTNMSLKEKQYLYFGFAFQKEYQPYTEHNEVNKLNKILQKKKIKESELSEILRLTENYLKINPFNIKIHQIQIYVYKRLRFKKQIKRKLNQIQIIKDAILSTGNGLTSKTAYHIIYANHQKIILKELSLIQKGNHRSVGTLEYLNIQPNNQNIEKLYFDLSLCFKQSI